MVASSPSGPAPTAHAGPGPPHEPQRGADTLYAQDQPDGQTGRTKHGVGPAQPGQPPRSRRVTGLDRQDRRHQKQQHRPNHEHMGDGPEARRPAESPSGITMTAPVGKGPAGEPRDGEGAVEDQSELRAHGSRVRAIAHVWLLASCRPTGPRGGGTTTGLAACRVRRRRQLDRPRPQLPARERSRHRPSQHRGRGHPRLVARGRRSGRWARSSVDRRQRGADTATDRSHAHRSDQVPAV